MYLPPSLTCAFHILITAKLVVISGNCPPLRKSELEYYAMLAKVFYSPSRLIVDKCASLYRQQVCPPYLVGNGY
jgi:hypothetical protein